MFASDEVIEVFVATPRQEAVREREAGRGVLESFDCPNLAARQIRALKVVSVRDAEIGLG
jgi:hypothetical protein